MNRKFNICACYICGKKEFEDKMLDYNDHNFCGIRCKLIQERKDDANISNVNIDRAQLRALGSRGK